MHSCMHYTYIQYVPVRKNRLLVIDIDMLKDQ